jgi:hypothetical protein
VGGVEVYMISIIYKSMVNAWETDKALKTAIFHISKAGARV